MDHGCGVMTVPEDPRKMASGAPLLLGSSRYPHKPASDLTGVTPREPAKPATTPSSYFFWQVPYYGLINRIRLLEAVCRQTCLTLGCGDWLVGRIGA